MRSLLGILLVAATALTGCGGDGDDEAPAAGTDGPPVSLEGPVDDHGTEDVGGAEEADLEMTLDDSYFAPTFVRAEPGEAVHLTLVNEGDATHTFTIDALSIDEQLGAGERAEVEVALPERAEPVVFYCRFHRAGGMQGAFALTSG
jgi:plastocyanin